MPGTKPNRASLNLIAPCGLNCTVCRAHMRQKNPCPGCRADDASKPKTRVICKIKTCPTLVQGHLEFCSGCDEFPCANLLHLDQRYRSKYGTSPVENLLSIRKKSLSKFTRDDIKKWTCPQCSALLCMHEPECMSCGYAWLK